jgi:hypothetical protein
MKVFGRNAGKPIERGLKEGEVKVIGDGQAQPLKRTMSSLGGRSSGTAQRCRRIVFQPRRGAARHRAEASEEWRGGRRRVGTAEV